MTQFYSRNDVNYSGDVYSIPFDYIDKKEVKVYIDDELWTEWHFLNKHQLTLDEVPAEIGYNNIISVRRETDIEEKVVTYDNNSLLNKENLNKSQDQLLFAVQEIYDNNVQFQSDIREEVDEKVERVSDAVEKLEFLEDSVEIANEAALEATEQAQIATEKAEETLNTYNEAMAEIDTLKQNSIKDIDQLVADHTNDLNSLDATIKKDADAIINRVGLNMFDTVLKDHVLTYEESKGLALQGTYIYKNAIVGERYGYADFYAKCLEEYQNAEYLPWTQPIATGETTAIDGGNMVITASSAYTGYDAYKAMDGTSSGTTSGTGWGTNNTTDVQWWQVKFPYKIRITGLTGYQRYDGTPAHANTIGQFYTSSDKTTPIGDEYNNAVGVNWNAVSVTGIPAEGIVTDTIYFEKTGGDGWGGFGELKIEATNASLKKNSNGHIFYDIAYKEAVDLIFEETGLAWFYGVDTENERVFLPRNNYFEQATGDISEVGRGVEAGLPYSRIYTETVGLDDYYGNEDGNKQYNVGGTSGGNGAILRAAGSQSNFGGLYVQDSNGTYGKTNTVQPNAVKKLLYICVGNTVADTSWVDVVTQVKGGVKDIEEAKDEAVDAMKSAIGGTVPLGFIGSAILGIDETLNLQRYLNGQIILQDQFKGFTKFLKRRVKLYPSLACAEDEWQTEVTMSAFSQCGKFVIDDIAGTIRLPKVVNIQGLTDLSKLGEIVEAGLPNIKGDIGRFQAYDFYTENPFYSHDTDKLNNLACVTTANAGGYGTRIGFDASLSNPIYSNSNTVQQEQIQYPYFIQVATGAETEDNIINEIELNNPFSLLDYKFSEYELNNLSWLRSNGQYNSKAIYPAVYDLLLKIYNGTETKAGVSVKLSTEEYTDYDFVLNTAEENFRLPIKVKLASGKAVVGNGMSLGFTNGTTNAGATVDTLNTVPAFIYLDKDAYGNPIGENYSAGGAIGDDNKGLGITTDATKSGVETSDGDLYLYFYVGETVQNANLINAGRIEEKLHSLIPDNSSLISGYGIPDYSAGVVKTWGTTYTAECDGWVYIRGDGSSTEDSKLLINNVMVSILGSGSNGIEDGSAFVSKGDLYQSRGGGGYYPNYRQIVFYPLKGAK